MPKERVPNGETREQKFKRLATKRVARILNDLRLLGNLANNSYLYSDEDVRKIFSAIEDQLSAAKSRFKIPKRGEFKL